MRRSNSIMAIVDRALTLTFCIIAVFGVSTLPAQDKAAIQKEFQNPARKYRPMVRWWWPGNDVTDSEIEREVGILDAAGFGGAEIDPVVSRDLRALPPDVMDRVNDFASPSFFSHVRTAMNAAKAHSMWLDYTFGTGWPFGGGPAITPELSEIELRIADTVVEGPKAFQGKLDIPAWQRGFLYNRMHNDKELYDLPKGWQDRLEARSKVVAVVAMRSVYDSAVQSPLPAAEKSCSLCATGRQLSFHAPEMLDRGSIVVLTDRMKPDGSLDWQIPGGKWHIFVFRQIPTRHPIAHASGFGPQFVLDHLKAEAFDAHARRVGDPLVGIGATSSGSPMRAIFCDSLELEEFIFWTDDFLEQFKQRRGYDLTPYLAILRQPGYNDGYSSRPDGLPVFDVADAGDAIRSDYWKTVSELMDERFFRKFDEWGKQHNLLTRVQSHGSPGDILKFYGDSDIPETEQLAGGNTVNFMKLASSAGYNYGHKIVSSEAFDLGESSYATTPESLKANTDKQLISGVNEMIDAGFPYTYKWGPQGIGWYPFQGLVSAHINEVNPFWPFIAKVNQYITRLQYIAQVGDSDLQIALFRSALNQDDTGPALSSGPVKDIYPAIEKAFTAAGLSFGFLNEDTLLAASAKGTKLATKRGGEYAALVIPRTSNVSPKLIESLKRLAAARVPVIFVDGLPGANASFKTLEQDRKQVADGLHELEVAPSTLKVPGPEEAASRLAALIQPQVHVTSGPTLPFLKKTIGETRFYLLTNPTSEQAEATVEFSELSAPELWDPWTGSVQQVAFTRKSDRINLALSLPPFGSELLAFNNARRNAPSPAPAVTSELKRQSVGEAGWGVDATGAADQKTDIHVHVDMAKLRDWRDEPQLHTFSGLATYTTHVSVQASYLQTAAEVLLELGEVKYAAEVKVNGVNAGQLIVHPFSVDVRPLLHAGENTIEITVANSLSNYATTIPWSRIPTPYKVEGTVKLLPSGLLGPVVLKYESSASQQQR